MYLFILVLHCVNWGQINKVPGEDVIVEYYIYVYLFVFIFFLFFVLFNRIWNLYQSKFLLCKWFGFSLSVIPLVYNINQLYWSYMYYFVGQRLHIHYTNKVTRYQILHLHYSLTARLHNDANLQLFLFK